MFGSPDTAAYVEPYFETMQPHPMPVRPRRRKFTGDKPQPLTKSCLQAALDGGEFVAFFQPQLDLHDVRLCGTEVLARWNHPELGLLGPAHFLESVRALGLMTELTRAMVWQAVSAARRWDDAGRQEVTVAINAEWGCIERGRLLKMLKDACAHYEVAPCRVHVELSEESAVSNLTQATAAIKALRKTGFRIALDDFGTGNSSLRLLREFECDVVKLDRSLIHGIRPDSRGAVMLRGLVRMSEALGAQVVAEGVETLSDLQCVAELGCDQAQGFFYGSPMAKSDLLSRFLS